ncbi:MAG: hypothetical protein IPN97_09795 [Saprospiraceae bacterium]|nr:hypothetical protein [Saprospiraceae bacterium]
MIKKIISIAFLVLVFISGLHAQKIKNLPEPFFAPIAYDDQLKRDQFAITGGAGKKGELWLVTGDRETIALLDKPNGGQSGQFLKFKETAFVMDESGEWVKIGVGSKEDNKFRNLVKSGWVKKQEILLWPRSLRDPETKITKKGFLLNKLDRAADIVNIDNHRKVKIYDGPNSSNVITDRDIYNVYFMFKEENNRILIGGADFLNQTNAKDIIIGWVDEGRVEKWNQRLTLECDWTDPSYSIRRNDVNKRVYGFDKQISADLYSKNGSLNTENIVWDNDPSKSDYPKKLKSEENSRRPVGDVFRFPVFKFTSGYIQSGAINKIRTTNPGGRPDWMSEELLIEMKNIFEKKIRPKRDNVNVTFLIEGSAKMAAYKANILAAIETVDFGLPEGVNIRYAAGIFRDANLSKDKWDFSYKSLTRDRRGVIDFVNNAPFNDYTDMDNVTNQRYAILQFLDKAGYSADQNNILIVIGACADFFYDFARAEDARVKKDPQLIEDESMKKISDKFTQYDMNIGFLQIENKTGRAYSKFAEDARGIIVNAAQQQYGAYKGLSKVLSGASIKAPEMPDLDEGNEIKLLNGVGYGMIKYPDRNTSFNPQNISSFIKDVTTKSAERTNKLYDYVKDRIDGQQPQTEELDESFSALVFDFISKLSPEAQKKILDEKIRLYRSLYLPLNIQGIGDPYQYVIFMPEVELEEYVAQLRDLQRAMNAPEDVIREQLYNTVIALILKMSGDKMSRKQIDNMDFAEFMSWVTGMNREGIKIDLKGISIKDILDKKKLTSEELNKWAKNLTDKEKKLASIVRNRGAYPYSYTVGEAVYFWLRHQ